MGLSSRARAPCIRNAQSLVLRRRTFCIAFWGAIRHKSFGTRFGDTRLGENRFALTPVTIHFVLLTSCDVLCEGGLKIDRRTKA